MRDEGPFLLEWVAYHRAIGFTDIIVCTNDCVDGSPDLLDRLQALGSVVHIPHHVGPGEKPQLAAYARAEDYLPELRPDWVMVLDADEFLNIHVGAGRVDDLVAAVPDATAFLVNWRIFGSAGQPHWEPGFVTERFTRAAPREHGVNLSFKTLFRKYDAYSCILMPHQPRYPVSSRQPELMYIDGGGRVLPAYFHDESRDAFLQSEPGRVSWALAQVNHYNTRSRDDYRVKHHRGGGLDLDWEQDEWWPVFDRNEEADVSIKARLPAARAVFENLMADPQVRRLHARCCELYRQHLIALRTGAQA